MIKTIKQAAIISFESTFNKVLFIFAFGLSLFLYFFAITRVVTFENFLKYNPLTHVALQIILSIANALLVALAIVLFSQVIKNKKNNESLNIVSAITSLVFSFISTGCYICGTVLPAFLGIAAPFATLPLGGIEIKFLTIPMLLYSIREFSKQVIGICEIKVYRNYSLRLSNDNSIQLNLKRLDSMRPIFISLFFIVIIYSLPLVIGDKSRVVNANAKFCIHSKASKPK